MGTGGMVIGVLKDIRTKLGKQIGDEVEVTLERDESKREIAVPDDLATALTESGLTELFEALSFTRRREIAGGVSEAKKAETRRRRIDDAVIELRSKD
jgi:uncharacterized protein YdeI (YjbR/CyaY-like superfamily)